jgi:hypothetical protein
VLRSDWVRLSTVANVLTLQTPMNMQEPNPGRLGTSPMPRARYGIEGALADIKRIHQEI